MDVRISCPICGQAEVESLPEHLQSHSKQSLIDILLVQHQQIRKQHSTPHPSIRVISRVDSSTQGTGVEAGSVENEGEADPLEDSSQIFLEFQPPSSEEIRSENGSGPANLLKRDPPTTRQSGCSEPILHIIQFDNPPESTVVVNENEKTDKFKNKAVEEAVKNHAKTAASNVSTSDVFNPPRTAVSSGHPTFVLVDHNPMVAGPSKGRSVEDISVRNLKSDSSHNATEIISPNTSIIQYIIDESGQITDAPQEEPDSWILADGRTIPVYSSLHQVSSVSETTPSCTMTVDISGSSIKRTDENSVAIERNPSNSQMHLDLMTDEEIPPRGEISEYEESISSVLSEDSNLRPNGMFTESRRSPATVLHEQSMYLNRKKRSPPKPLLPQQQYTCHECPQAQVFSSLFELAEHKFESHQNKSLASSTTKVTITPSEPVILDSLHILPEKIRRQSQTDELLDPLVESKPSTSEMVSATNLIQKTKKEYFCVYCSFTTRKRSLLADHMASTHEGKPLVPAMFECTYCGKVFNARTNLRKHILIHKERKYNCPTCSKGFTSNFKLIEHMRVHTKSYPFKCNGCEKTYRTPSLLNYHIKMVHLPENERPPKRKLEFYCSTCHRVLHSKRSYLNHMQLHQEKPMKCSFCSEVFTRHSVLVRHIRIVHDPQYESKESKDCPVCHKKLHPNSMIKHMRIHSNEKPYSCNVCSKVFRTHANLTSHSWSHKTNQEKPHKCRLCSKSYLFKKNLENHMMVHKKRSHFVCNECGVKFTHKVNMKRHLEEHFKEKKHVCKTCGKAFQRNYYLIEHERIHSGVKPFVCNICGKSSTTKSNHRAHLKIHDARETGNQEG